MTALQVETPWIPVDTFGARLLLMRKQKGLTVEQAARLCGVAQPTWTTWENGSQPRNAREVVQKIAGALNVDRDWLMWGGPLTEDNKSRIFRLDLVAV